MQPRAPRHTSRRFPRGLCVVGASAHRSSGAASVGRPAGAAAEAVVAIERGLPKSSLPVCAPWRRYSPPLRRFHIGGKSPASWLRSRRWPMAAASGGWVFSIVWQTPSATCRAAAGSSASCGRCVRSARGWSGVRRAGMSAGGAHAVCLRRLSGMLRIRRARGMCACGTGARPSRGRGARGAQRLHVRAQVCAACMRQAAVMRAWLACDGRAGPSHKSGQARRHDGCPG